MESVKVTVSSRGYIVLPASLRKEMEISPGTRMLLTRKKDKIVLQAIPSFTQKLSGCTAQIIGGTPGDVDNFINTERRERS